MKWNVFTQSWIWSTRSIRHIIHIAVHLAHILWLSNMSKAFISFRTYFIARVLYSLFYFCNKNPHRSEDTYFQLRWKHDDFSGEKAYSLYRTEIKIKLFTLPKISCQNTRVDARGQNWFRIALVFASRSTHIAVILSVSRNNDRCLFVVRVLFRQLFHCLQDRDTTRLLYVYEQSVHISRLSVFLPLWLYRYLETPYRRTRTI